MLVELREVRQQHVQHVAVAFAEVPSRSIELEARTAATLGSKPDRNMSSMPTELDTY
jgi:hypothetical protein